MYNQPGQYIEDFFVYQIDFAALAPAGTANGTIQVQADSDFKWIKSAYISDIAAAAFLINTIPIPLITIQVVDTGSGRNLMSSAVPINNLFGPGSLPFIMPVPRIFKARSSIGITVQNYSAATTYNLRLSLIGTKIFKVS